MSNDNSSRIPGTLGLLTSGIIEDVRKQLAQQPHAATMNVMPLDGNTGSAGAGKKRKSQFIGEPPKKKSKISRPKKPNAFRQFASHNAKSKKGSEEKKMGDGPPQPKKPHAMTELGKQWRSMTDEQKLPFDQAAKKEQVTFQQDLTRWFRDLPADHGFGRAKTRAKQKSLPAGFRADAEFTKQDVQDMLDELFTKNDREKLRYMTKADIEKILHCPVLLPPQVWQYMKIELGTMTPPATNVIVVV
jgi:hypothetical protein